MLTIKKVLLPVDIPNASLGVIHQCAMLAGHFHAQVIMLHVVTALSHAAGVPYAAHKPANWDLLSVIRSDAEKQQDQALARPARWASAFCASWEKATRPGPLFRRRRGENADLIMMPSHGFTFDQFLLGSVTARVLNRTECPVWTGAHLQQSLMQPFAIRNVLCAVDLGDRSDKAVCWAAQIAGEFSAGLTLAHVTASVDIWGPGGWHADEGLERHTCARRFPAHRNARAGHWH